MRLPPPAIVRVLVRAILVLAVAAPANAQQKQAARVVRQPEIPGQPAAPAEPPRRGLRDRAELESFIDGVMEANLRDKHVAGATVSVVKDGAPFFAKGYGFANVARRQPVDGERSLFRIGSISKLFTWTAVMQLVEQGKLDLDTDVNTYIDFKIPATYPQPITLRAIMTHTPGFEEDGRDLFTADSTRMIPLGRWVATHLPARVRPPLTYSSYSNYATALAGYIVARASGISWDDYIEQRILTPLGMSQTTGRQPLPAKFRTDMSDGHLWAGGAFKPEKWEIVNGASPAGSVSASATDMQKFMLAHLGNGAYGGQRILGDSTAVRMHTRAFGHDPRLPGFALGFYEKSSHGLRIIGHGGDTRLFHSDLALIPSEGIGVFVSYNTATGGELSFGPFLNQFLDHYYPTTPPPTVLPSTARAQALRVSGEYTFNRRSYTTFQKAFGLTGDIGVTSNDSGIVVLQSPLGAMRLVPVGEMLYREELGDNLVSFKADDGAGQAQYGFLGMAPMMVMERLAWYQQARVHWVVLGLGVLVFVGTLVAAGRRAFRHRLGVRRPEDSLPWRWLLVVLAVVNVAFLIAVVAILAASGGLLENPLTGLKVALALPVLGTLLTLAAAAAAVVQWRTGAGTRGARLRYATTVLVAVLFIWSLNQWNLLGWRM